MTLWNEVKVTKSVPFLPKIHSYQFIRNSLTGLGDHYFLKFGSLSPNVTLKNRSGSYKLNELLIVYTHISLVRIRQFVQKKPGTQMSWLCWGLTSQSTIFQSCRDGAIASWVINQYFRGVKCLAQGHNTAAVGLEPRTSRSGVRHSTTEPPRSPTQMSVIPYQCKCWCKQDRHRNPFIPSPPREGDKKHMSIYESQCRVYFPSCTKLDLPLVWSKLPNFRSKSTDLVQHPTWINPEVTWLCMSWLN